MPICLIFPIIKTQQDASLQRCGEYPKHRRCFRQSTLYDPMPINMHPHILTSTLLPDPPGTTAHSLPLPHGAHEIPPVRIMSLRAKC